jgi:hypothetical protein
MAQIFPGLSSRKNLPMGLGREQKTGKWGNHFLFRISVGILEQSMGARNRVGKWLLSCPATPPGYIVWRNQLLGIDSWARLKFKNIFSELLS